MDEDSERALSQIDLAEAELAVLKQEGVLRNSSFYRRANRRSYRATGPTAGTR